ncbi:hypothetical protein AYO20_11406 [Fonsecaea nubica]|uniref:Uncharacterized protein n=1 Tax=Fonsecaea nubica TaxID=856822 RepID=A0A178BUI9_9EURO|nr:hypothetical protein AYO20_11406 [Fonsecaea nubica]OAL21288.1 hypothetical protein AYO20_11406 [Fonsecaea nubica]
MEGHRIARSLQAPKYLPGALSVAACNFMSTWLRGWPASSPPSKLITTLGHERGEIPLAAAYANPTGKGFHLRRCFEEHDFVEPPFPTCHFYPSTEEKVIKSFPLPLDSTASTSEPARTSLVRTQPLPRRFGNFDLFINFGLLVNFLLFVVGNRDLQRTGHEQVGEGKKVTGPHVVLAAHRPWHQDVAPP